ncbi:VCBS repeat-containing protein [Desulfovibrio aminophilus]|nr:FG-GAP-like repeat-containing protein [Desulfovibrio aminophilus]MCM0755964.1 VCBS repeat-containing protein [Desulfovibrio aminophilus]
MKLLRNISIALILTLTLAGTALAQTAKTYAVLPFKVNGPEKFLYLGPAVQSMLTSRLTAPGKFEALPKEAAASLGVTPPAGGTQAQSMLARVNGQYLYWGTVNVLGDHVTLELQRADAKGQSKVVTKDMSMEGLVPGLDALAKEQLAELFGAPSQPAAQAEQRAAAPSNPAFLAAQGTNPADPIAAVNPQFRYEGGAETPGQWRTQNLKYASRGMVIADANGDRRQEVFILGQHALYAYSLKNGRLDPLDSVDFTQKYELLYIGAVDADGNGVQDIVISSFRDGQPYSMIFSFVGNKLERILDGARVYLSVVAMPPTYSPTLIGQKQGSSELFSSKNIYEYHLSGKNLVEGKHIALPEFANVYNFAYFPDQNGYKVVLINEDSHIQVFNQALDLQSSSDETYNSSAIDLDVTTALPGMTGGGSDFTKQSYYLPMPMKITSFSAKGKYELLVNKDISVAAQIFGRFRTFTQGELHALFWDGVGMNLAWKTRRIKGTVVGFQVADPNNDGKQDLCVLVNTYPGTVGLEYRKTVLMGYELNTDAVQK